MKKHLFSLIGVACTLSMLNAQNIIPNGSFENWVSSNFELPANYPISSANELFFKGINPNVEKTTDAYQGQYAVKLTTVKFASDTTGAWFADASKNVGGDPSLWKGGIPYDQIPTGFKGYYKYNVESKDSALVGLVFKKNGTSYAHYYYAIGGIHTSYTPFEFTFKTPLTQAPDTIIFVATSSNLLVFSGIPGSTMILDNVSLTGVSSQPELFNGDFEIWANQTNNLKAVDWNTDDTQNQGVNRTTDAYAGNYALELRTYQGRDDYNQPIAQNGWIEIGYYNNGNTFLKGFPFNKAQDKLVFYYKYAPQNPNDKANITIQTKRNGIATGGSGLQLTASATYKYTELNINTNDGLPPDSAYISINSSDWNNRDLSYVGASLKIDGLVFKSQIAGNQNIYSDNLSIGISPNPINTSGVLDIQPATDLSGFTLNIYSTDGKLKKQINVTTQQTTINKSDFPSGIYYWDVVKENVSLKKGKLIIL